MSVVDYCKLVRRLVRTSRPLGTSPTFADWRGDHRDALAAVRLANRGQLSAALKVASRLGWKWGAV